MMTVNRLHKLLAQLMADGHGRKPVCIDKTTFRHPCEDDGTVILDVATLEGPRFVGTSDDDGGTQENKDGTESGRRVVVLKGDYA